MSCLVCVVYVCLCAWSVCLCVCVCVCVRLCKTRLFNHFSYHIAVNNPYLTCPLFHPFADHCCYILYGLGN